MSDDPTLLPCPFCEADAEVERYGTPRQSAIVECTGCGCRVESNENGAGHAWNHRSCEDALRAELARVTAERDRLMTETK
jgi:hypothetical protein